MNSLLGLFLAMLFSFLLVALVANYKSFENKFENQNQIKKIENITRTYETYRF